MISQHRRIVLIIAIVCFILLPVLSLAGTIELPRTGQVWSYDANTPQRDDGAIQAGAVWPDPRFTDNGDQTVKDNLTGLIWTKDAGTPAVTGMSTCASGTKTWQQALDYVACLNANSYLGHNDWRLPNINELESLVDFSQAYLAMTGGHPFTNVQSRYYSSNRYWSSYYWSSSTNVNSTYYAWDVSIFNGQVSSDTKDDVNYVWPVCGGQCGLGDSVICLPKTGQTVSYAAGDDGDLKEGVARPSPRFTDNSNETITDNMTGLIWTKNANALGPKACGSGTDKTWQEALDYVACLNTNSYCGYSDWRLPDIKELYSLIDRLKYEPALPTGHPFTGVQPYWYWSSSTYAVNTDYAWIVYMSYGSMDVGYKSDSNYVWPVRGGQFGSSVICSFAVSPASENFIYSGGTDTVPVTASQNICEWSALSNAAWMTITSGQSGTGNGAVTFTLSANNGSGPRTGMLTIAGQTYTVNQLNSAPDSEIIDLPKTGQTMSYAAGDDGDLGEGVPWPSTRFTDNGDETVKDNLTGLVWSKDAGTPAVTGMSTCAGDIKTWQQALDYVACLNTNTYLGHNDWRLPNINELYSLVDRSKDYPGYPFENVQFDVHYWSSSGSTLSAWYVNMGGLVGDYNKSAKIYVWPVRSGQCGSLDNSAICLPKTGQTTSYATGDDGDLGKGAGWPEPRFICNGDGTVTDNLTGLTWTKDTKTPGLVACGPGTYKTWQEALNYVTCLNTNTYLGHNDWRLPNINELYSLVDRSKYSPALPIGYPFAGVQSGNYWSSSTLASSTISAWVVDIGSGRVATDDKYSSYYNYYVWPVRGGRSGSFDGFVISVSKTGAGSGTVTASAGVRFWDGNTSAATFPSGTQLTLTATPDSNFTFAGWSGCDSSSGNICTVTLTTAKSVTVAFAPSCTSPFVPQSKSFTYKSSTSSLSVTALSSSCTWTAVSDSIGWLTITSGSNGTGNKTVRYSVAANTSTSARIGHITIGDQTFTVTQAGGTPKISVPASLNIGNVKKDVASDTKMITVKNTGTANLEISDVTITGTSSSEFAYEKTGCDSVAPQGSCTISVTMTATSYGSKSATLSITSNGATKPTAVKLSGNTVPPAISVPASLSFTKTTTGSTSAPKTVMIKNTGLSDLLVGDVTISGTNPSDFAPTKNCPLALAKNEICTVTVTFTPSATGKKSATMNIASNDPKKATATVKLSGKGK